MTTRDTVVGPLIAVESKKPIFYVRIDGKERMCFGHTAGVIPMRKPKGPNSRLVVFFKLCYPDGITAVRQPNVSHVQAGTCYYEEIRGPTKHLVGYVCGWVCHFDHYSNPIPNPIYRPFNSYATEWLRREGARAIGKQYEQSSTLTVGSQDPKKVYSYG